MTYHINWNYMMEDEIVEGTLEEAMKIADDGAAYTQQNINIKDEDGKVVASRSWWGTVYDPDETEDAEDEIISFGSFGYFGAWEY
jgi:hypothetical protein